MRHNKAMTERNTLLEAVIFIYLLSCIFLTCNAQGLGGLSRSFVVGAGAGAAWGTHEVTAHHYPAFQAAFPNANPQFWNPAISHTNKYWRNVPAHISDAKHLLASGNQVLLVAGAFDIGFSSKGKGWKYAVKKTLAFSFGYFVGNFLTYDLIKNRGRIF